MNQWEFIWITFITALFIGHRMVFGFEDTVILGLIVLLALQIKAK